MKIAVLLLMVIFITILFIPAMAISICRLYLDVSNIIYDLFIGLVTGLITSLISFYFANVIPKRRLKDRKYKQYIEIIKRHGGGLAYAYSGAYAAFYTFNNYYRERDFLSKDLWLMFNRRATAVTNAVERIMSLHSEFNTNIALILDVIPDGCVENLKKASLDLMINLIMSSYNEYTTFISSNTKKKYTQDCYDVESKLHDAIICYMMAVKILEDYNKIYPKTGIATFQPISSMIIKE